MFWWQRSRVAWVVMCGLGLSPVGGRLSAQGASATEAQVRGAVVDPSGAQVAGAQVHAELQVPVKGKALNQDHDTSQESGLVRDVTADGSGHFLLALPGGTYLFTVQSPGFDPYVRENLKVDAGQHIDLAVKLLVATQAEVVNVPADANSSTDPADNKDALVFKGDQLQLFSDNDNILQQQLAAIAGGDPSLPPQILVDGFSNGQFPSKASIREIRFNQNPYSAQYDMPGQGRVEVFTKPGSQVFHGFFALYGNDSALNARNPYVQSAPLPYDREHLFGDVNGPLGKNMGFDFSLNLTRDQNNTPINATVLDSGLNVVPVQGVVASPGLTQNYSPRVDRQIGANDTATARYSVYRARSTNGGISVLGLPSQAINTNSISETVQLGDTHVAGTKVVIESRFQYNRTKAQTDPVSSAPTLSVQGSFTGGGSAAQVLHDHTDRYEFQEYVSLALRHHFIRTGARYRLTRDANLATSGFNGQYIFQDLATYGRAIADVRAGLTGAQIAAKDDGPSQFSINAGLPTASVMTGDVGVYAEDDWKARPDLTVSFGGRLESQSAIPDHLDLAPRVGAAWAPVWKKSKTPFATFRAGFGMFYDRFDSGNLLQTIRQNGTREQGYYLESPGTFGCQEGTAVGATCTPVVPSVSSLAALQPSIYKLSPHFHADYQMRGGITVDHTFGSRGSASVGWIRSRQVHQPELLNINAPLPGTYVVGNPASGVRPLGTAQNVYQYSSDGVRNIDSLQMNGNFRPNGKTFLWASYSLASRTSDTSGANSMPSNQYNLTQDYGPAVNYSAQQFNGGGGGDLPFGFNGNLYLSYRSAQRFNITVGQDLNGDTSYNDRPTFATDLSRASVVRTAYGNFDTLPTAGQTLVPFNYATGPGMFYSEIWFARDFTFGKPHADAVKAADEVKLKPGQKKPKAEQPYKFEIGVEIDNVLNTVNPAMPVGVLPSAQSTQALTQAALQSSNFGKSISQNGQFAFNGAANRTVHLAAHFQF